MPPVEVGDQAPDVALSSHKGSEVRLSDYRGKKNVVLHVLVSAFTKGWAHQLSDFQVGNRRFQERNAQVLGMSVEGTPVLKAFAAGLGGVSFPLLSDSHPKGEVCSAYGIYNEEDGRPKRAVFIIDTEGIVRFKKVYERGLPKLDEILAELDKL